MAYTRRQELMCTEAQMIAKPNVVLRENEAIYIKMNDGTLRQKIGDGVTAIINLPFTKVFDGSVVQTTGDSETAVMSQKATTDELNSINNRDLIYCYFAEGINPQLTIENDAMTATLNFSKVQKLIAKNKNGLNVGEFTVDDILNLASTITSLTVDIPNKKISGKAFTFAYDTKENTIKFYANYMRNPQDIIVFHNFYCSTIFGVIVDTFTRNDAISRSNQDIAIMPDAACKFYFESTHAMASSLFFSFTDWIYIRGKVRADKGWTSFKSLFPDRIVTTEKGVECIEIPHNYALFVDTDGVFTIERWDTNICKAKTPIFIVSSGNVCGGIGEYLYTRYFANENGEVGIAVEDYFTDEVEDCVTKLLDECTQKSLVFAVLSDSHYNGSNNTKNTIKNIGAVNSKYKLDGVYHLGDIVNGDSEKVITTALISEVRNGLYEVNPESYLITGNHDDNSFTSIDSHPHQYTKAEQYSIMCRYKDVDVERPSNKLYWYKDYHSFGVRVVCLDSHMGEGTNGYGSSWGYPIEVVNWVRDVALKTEHQVLFMTHIPLTADYNAYQSETVNAEELRSVITDFINEGGTVIGFIHGHTHWDFIGMKKPNTFHEISIGASNTTMSYGSYKPDEAVVQERTTGTVTEDLWDIVVVQPEVKRIKMIRFGAGTDREIYY